MCGILGAFALAPGLALDASWVARGLPALAHRGPDGERLQDLGCAVLGFRRLAILDLSPAGMQPFSTGGRGGVHAVVNGEIYNHHSLRALLLERGVELRSNSDAEVVPHLYAAFGDDFVERLEGMFALALVDVPRRRLVLARDRLGKKPLYVRRAGGRVEFASEAKALLGDETVRADPSALLRFLTFGVVPAPHSAFAGVERVEPGALWIAEQGEPPVIKTARWWAPPGAARETPDSRTVEEHAEELDRLLRLAVAARLESDVPLGVFLSGGIDSGLVLAGAVGARGAGNAPEAFTVGFDDPRYDERELASRSASHLGARLHVLDAVLDAESAPDRVAHAHDEPFGDPSALPTDLLCARAREHVTVALCGDGGDELFAGYRRHQAVRLAGALDSVLPGALLGLAGKAFSEPGNGVGGRDALGEIRRFCTALALPPDARSLYWATFFRAPLRARYLHPDLLAAAGGVDPEAEALAALGDAPRSPLRRALDFDLRRYLPDDLLVKVDIASMAHGLEVRAPFLDRRIVEFAASLPDGALNGAFSTKRVPRALARRLLPRAVAGARKRGFGVPLARWLRGPLLPLAQRRLTSARFDARRILRPGAAQELIARHVGGAEDWSSYLWLLLVLDAWFALRVEGDAEESP